MEKESKIKNIKKRTKYGIRWHFFRMDLPGGFTLSHPETVANNFPKNIKLQYFSVASSFRANQSKLCTWGCLLNRTAANSAQMSKNSINWHEMKTQRKNTGQILYSLENGLLQFQDASEQIPLMVPSYLISILKKCNLSQI